MLSMKKTAFALLTAAMLPVICFAGKTFEVDFDDYGVAPGIAKGDKRVFRFKDGDLQLRMFPGVNGKGNSLNLANSECVEYLMPKNFDPKGGTVSIWVCPINWQLYGEGWQTFFFAWQKNFQLRINKLTPGYIEATIVNRPAGDKQHALTAVARCDAADWAPGRWHKIDVTWDEEKISLYIDGKIPQKTPDKIGKNTRVRPTNPIRLFKAKQTYPDALGRFCVGTRHDWQNRKQVNREHKTAIDKLTIRNRVLGPVEIRKEYEMVIPPAPVQAALNFASIPCQQGDLPGVTHIAHHSKCQIRVQAHTCGQRKGEIGHESHTAGTYKGSKCSGKQNRRGVHTGFGQNIRVDRQNVGHRHEGRHTGHDFRLHICAVL